MSELNATTLVSGFVWYIAFLFSTTCHDASHALAGFVARWPAGHDGYNPDCVLSIEPAAGDIQPFSSASAGWQHRSDGVHGRLDGEAVYELAANHALSELGIAGGAAGVPLLLCAGGEVRDKFAAIHEILINDLLRQFDTVQKNCFAA